MKYWISIAWNLLWSIRRNLFYYLTLRWHFNLFIIFHYSFFLLSRINIQQLIDTWISWAKLIFIKIETHPISIWSWNVSAWMFYRENEMRTKNMSARHIYRIEIHSNRAKYSILVNQSRSSVCLSLLENATKLKYN